MTFLATKINCFKVSKWRNCCNEEWSTSIVEDIFMSKADLITNYIICIKFEPNTYTQLRKSIANFTNNLKKNYQTKTNL
jgi:hypothetical protein